MSSLSSAQRRASLTSKPPSAAAVDFVIGKEAGLEGESGAEVENKGELILQPTGSNTSKLRNLEAINVKGGSISISNVKYDADKQLSSSKKKKRLLDQSQGQAKKPQEIYGFDLDFLEGIGLGDMLEDLVNDTVDESPSGKPKGVEGQIDEEEKLDYN
eukprot:CAMPEP_0168612018 /NCGR_PEP_ID=MMETSP0449_2-20121227/2679_1 /TAXON_ID=1082188 /ORGANISM="Strombidium rassoulzadegani, Strain ras09" /LENGTH=157 /DNA_ID=CAMNT_0008652527 /DNA_START=537 /DNA_END=1010 /DNA_ORIENTATION=-